MFFLTEKLRRLAYLPTMEIYRREIAVTGEANGIEMAGNGFVKIGLARPIGFLYGAPTGTVGIIAGKDAILSVDNRGNPIALLINIRDALPLDNLSRLRRKIFPDNGQQVA